MRQRLPTPPAPQAPPARRPRRRSFSLRTRVAAAAALGAIILTVLLGWLSVLAINRNNLAQADQELTVASRIVLMQPVIAVGVLSLVNSNRDLAITIRESNGALNASTTVQLPQLDPGSHTVTLDDTPYRVLTTTVNQPQGRVVSMGIPLTDSYHATSEQRRWVLSAAALAMVAAAGLGWVFGGRAVRPIVDLTRQVGEHSGTGESEAPVDGSGVREAEQLAEAVNSLLERVRKAQAETAAALDTARDFAAVSAHELRTPLTAMRTDIEVLRTLDLDANQRAEILADLQRSESRVEATLAALERLAAGELTNEGDHVETDIADLVDQSAHDAMRHFPALTVRIDTDAELITRGLPTGLRLAVDNALTNSFKHGGATQARVSAHRGADRTIVIAVDDNGRGIPAAEREMVFERFIRGSEATKSGSGLGLALVAQQAQLHGGRAYFEDSELGGVRLVLELPPR
ncbi:HAMP domain-containing histidine kinase [Nocardia sp. NEAU-G5]|uniref:histidine kinase n=1 Tax=Nocardia albiluteola TaxID=2842303 RepID=A0ABS6AWD5_9NOCA|nr:HAMP domain-containing sensor histidine kinase [Nocardia albiluteola]MBU3061285.1 HAMP domain-containing histidine kinase [Nocardia albiluteola]